VIRRPIFPKGGTVVRGSGATTVLSRPPFFVSRIAETTSVDPTAAVISADPSALQVGDAVVLWEPYPAKGMRWGHGCRYLIIERIVGRRVEGICIYGQDGIDYRKENNARLASNYPAFFLRGAPRVVLESLTIDGGFTGIGEGVAEKDTGDFFQAAILVSGGSDDCRIRDVTVRGWFADGICVDGGVTGVSVTGCLVERCANIGLHPGGGCQLAQFIGNISRHNRYGFLFCQGNRNVICANNAVHDNHCHGIWGLDANDQGCVVAHNCCYNNGWHGIEATGCANCVIEGNICRSNSRAMPGVFAGIHLENHQNCVVTGNLCYDDQKHATQATGLRELTPKGGNVVANNVAMDYSADWQMWPKEWL